MRNAICPGSFDPVTLGHMDIIERAAGLYDRLVIAVLHNPKKKQMFTGADRAELIHTSAGHLPNVEVVTSDKMLIDLCRELNIYTVVKGLRAVSDFEIEFQMALINRKLCPEMETVFLSAGEGFQYLSSSVVKEIGGLGGDISPFVPASILRQVMQKLRVESEPGQNHSNKRG